MKLIKAFKLIWLSNMIGYIYQKKQGLIGMSEIHSLPTLGEAFSPVKSFQDRIQFSLSMRNVLSSFSLCVSN